MATQYTARRPFFKTKRGIMLLALLCLLMLNLTMMSVSLAKYVSNANAGHGAGVAGFTPTISCGESWEQAESFVIMGGAQQSELPFAVSNATGTTPVLVCITLTTEGVLPLSFQLFAGSEPLSLTEHGSGVYVCEHPMGQVDTTFSLQIGWQDGVEYDEHYNGLSNDVQLVVTCEQAQVGGAP